MWLKVQTGRGRFDDSPQRYGPELAAASSPVSAYMKPLPCRPLLLINLIRIVSLYYFGVWFSPKVFEVMHLEVWQMAFILMPILLWLFWVRRVSKAQVTQSDATA